MKRFVSALFLVPLLVVLATLPLMAGEKVYQDPAGAYSFSYPHDFECQANTDKHNVTLISKERALGIIIGAVDAKSFPGSNIQKLCKQFPVFEQMTISAMQQQGFKTTSKNSVSFKGIPAITYGLEGTVQGRSLSGLCLTFINKGSMYMLFFFGAQAQHAQNMGTFNAFLKSFTM